MFKTISCGHHKTRVKKLSQNCLVLLCIEVKGWLIFHVSLFLFISNIFQHFYLTFYLLNLLNLLFPEIVIQRDFLNYFLPPDTHIYLSVPGSKKW